MESGAVTIIQERAPLCFKCVQCMAICPEQAVFVSGYTYDDDFFDLPKYSPNPAAFFDLIMSRRAIRNFQERPVPRELLEKIVTAIAMAPPGLPPIKTEITVVQNTSLIREALPYLIDDYTFICKAMQNPILRRFIKKRSGREMFRALDHHVVPMMKQRLPGLRAGTEDTIMRKAPAMILFHANRDSVLYREDIHIAVTYAFLASHAVGLGGTAMTIVYPIVENNKKLRTLFSIPENNEVVGTVIIGYPKYRYRRGIRRTLKNITWL